MTSYPAKFKSFQPKVIQMGALEKLQNSTQILIILWLVYPINTNSLFQVIFEELSFCHVPPPNTSILGKDSQIYLIFHLNVLVLQTNVKQPYSFPVFSRFCNCLSFRLYQKLGKLLETGFFNKRTNYSLSIVSQS